MKMIVNLTKMNNTQFFISVKDIYVVLQVRGCYPQPKG